ncbi:AraC family transcriptional regulator [Atopomonas hussainii]|uniref:AraC family transcriptional regulator n=1 Tax=Atopomonas hussainii TaxID=1429083 RepID=UPI0009002FAE|nr:AraC family transcriptional regulator [Atopomonas hussainii]
MATRPMLGFIYVLKALQTLGEPVERVLAERGLALEQLDPAGQISRQLELAILSDLAPNLRDPGCGLAVGDEYRFAGYGVLSMLLMTCTNLLEAVQLGVRFQQLTYLYCQLRFVPGRESSQLLLEPAGLPEALLRFRVDAEMAGTLRLVKDLTALLGVTVPLESVQLPYAKPADAARYPAFFACPVQFGCATAGFTVSNSALRHSLPVADRSGHSLYLQQCEQLLAAQMQSAQYWRDQVLAHLSVFQGQYPDADQVAASLGLSGRSLRRYLAEEGVSFRELLAQARRYKAEQLLLRSQHSVEQIAAQLGYSEPAAFIHAFKRWTGSTPYQFRLQAR